MTPLAAWRWFCKPAPSRDRMSKSNAMGEHRRIGDAESKRETGGNPTATQGREVKGCTRNFAHDESSLASSRFV